MSTAAPVFDAQQLIVTDPVIGRAAEHAFRDAAQPVRIVMDLLGQDPWDSVPRVARLVGSSDPPPVDLLYDLLLDDRRGHGASMVFRFLKPKTLAGLGGGLRQRRRSAPHWMLIRAVGEYADPRDAGALLTEAKVRDYESEVVREVLKALERMLLAQRDADDAEHVFRAFRNLLSAGKSPPAFPLHPSWHVFRVNPGWLEPVIAGFDEPPDKRRAWSARAAAWLGLSHAARAVPVLGRVVADSAEPPDVRIAAVEALADNAQEGALEAVARAGTAAGTAPDDALPAAIDAAAARLAWQSDEAADLALNQIARAKETGNHSAYAHALYTLGRSGSTALPEEVDRALVHPEWTVRGAAGIALASHAEPDAVKRLEAALAEASEPIERLQLVTALALADPEARVDALHERLCTREVGAPWALVNPVRHAIMEAFEEAVPFDAERHDAWAEVLNMAPAPTAPARPPPPPPTPTAKGAPRLAKTVEPGRGTPNAQADAEATVDRLGRAPLVDILVGMLDDPDQGTPFTFGLFGGWGEGKSSVLRQLEGRLTSPNKTHRFRVAWFNAWQYERTENLAAGLVQETVKALVPESRSARIRLAWKFAWRTHRAKLLWAMTLLLVSAAATIYGFVATDNSVAKAILGAGGLSVLSAIGAVLVKLYRHPVATELWTYFRLPDYGQHLGLLPVMREQLQTLWAIQPRDDRKRRSRLVVVVDDLDRCAPAAIAATLDAVRLVMDMEDVLVIVALDERICLRAVADEYEALTTPERSESAIARDFLAKIVQLPVRLEPPDSLDEFLEYELFRGEGRAAASKQAGANGETRADGGNGAAPAQAPPSASEGEAMAQEQIRQAPDIAYSAQQASDAAARLQREAMRDTSDEREAFEEMARASDIHNPRQLRRLRNTYRFIKTNSASLDWNKLMAMLFWQDCLHMLPTATFEANRARPTPGSSAPDGVPEELAAQVAALFDQDDADEADLDFELYREAVLVAVLPRLDLTRATTSQP